MAVYASLVSLIHVINHTQNPPLPYAFLVKLQTQPLFDQVSFLLEFVEDYSQPRSNEIELLESRIAVAAYAAEDIIETFVVDQILKKNTDKSYAISSEGLEKVVREMDLITKEVLKTKADYKHLNEKKKQQQQQQQARHISIEAAVCSSSSIDAKAPPPGGKINTTMVGFDEDLIKLKEKLTTYQSDRLVIQVVGMGGIGKTTLATNTYEDPFVKSYFVIRAWVTISQDFSLRKVILGLLDDTDNMRDMSDDELGEKLHKFLFGRKYLIVLDDIWSITAWDEISRFLPPNSNESRIMMTARLSILTILGSSLNSTYEMKFLDDDISWNLLSEKVFGRGEKVCPHELEETGRIIAKNCRGLPLAITVIGGLLKVSDKTQEYWSEVAENVSSIVNKENDEQCLRILSLSYNQLPIQLKPLFLYMAIFPEDFEVRVSRLIQLWVAEGFLKLPPDIINITLEEVAKKYFKDLIDRNLIMVQRQGFRGNIKTCKIHDLLRDICLREAQKERFLCTEKMYDAREDITCERRLGMHSNEFLTMPDLRLVSLARTVVIGKSEIPSESSDIISYFNLLRVVNVYTMHRILDILKVVNSRYLAFSLHWYSVVQFSSLPWNLETLIVNGFTREGITLPSEIWEMQHLRHIKFKNGVYLSKPDGSKKCCVLNNLQTLSEVSNFRFTNEILDRILNLKKLGFTYEYVKETEEEMTRFHYNLVRLQKLEILKCEFITSTDYNLKISQINFPPTLKKLSLYGSWIPWENMNIVGSLPNLEVLKLGYEAFCGLEWNSTDQGEDQFQCLRFLSIESDLQIWRADSTNFPALEHLVLENCKELEEIPLDIGEIPSLQSITLHECKKSLIISAQKIHLIVQEQGINDDLLIKVYYTSDEHDEMQSLASHNFQVEPSGLKP